jgi:hypothetical protein
MKRSSVVAALLAAVSVLCVGAGGASAAANYVTVTQQNFNAIFDNTDVRPTSSYAFRFGPAKPPLGVGSLQLVTADSSGKQQHLEDQQQGTLLSAIDGMGYSTYRESRSTTFNPFQVTAINVAIFTNPGGPPCPNDAGAVAQVGCNTFTTLVFEPIYNLDQGTVTPDVWQTWDAYRGGTARWWTSRNIPGVCAFDCFLPWSAFVAANPNAVVIAYGVNQGSGNPGLTSDVDALKISAGGDSSTYDFEPSVEDCKNGGYATFDPPFKNQGQCVSAVRSNRGGD